MSEIKSIKEIQLNGKPWGQVYDSKNMLMACATYIEEEHQLEVVTISLSDLKNPLSYTFDFEGVQILQALSDGVFIFSSFDEENAKLLKLSAFDSVANAWLWELENYRLDGIDKHLGVIVSSIEDKEQFSIDKDGSMSPVAAALDLLSSGVIKANVYDPESDHYATVSEFLTKKYSVEVKEHIEYLEFKSLIVISYYLYQEEGMSNFLLILDENGEELLHEKLAGKLKGVGLESFYGLDNFIVAINDQNRLKFIEL